MRRIFSREPREKLLDEQIEKVLLKMAETDVLSTDYPKLVAYLDRLMSMRQKDRREPVSWDVLAQVAGSLLGIVIIVAYEQKHVMTSRGFTQLIVPRIFKK